MTKEPRENDGADVVVKVARSLVLPRKLQTSNGYAIWRDSGCGSLLARLASEDALGATADPLKPEELAELIELFQDEPLPSSLRKILLNELRNKRRLKPGPKGVMSPQAVVELAMLPAVYKDAMGEARQERQELIAKERAKPRRATEAKVSTVSKLAADRVRKWLPTLQHLSDKAIANKLSELKR